MDQIITVDILEKMKQVEIKNIDIKKLVEIGSVTIDETASVPERVLQFIDQIKNPYCFRVGDVAVKVSYQEEGDSFQENFEKMILSL